MDDGRSIDDTMEELRKAEASRSESEASVKAIEQQMAQFDLPALYKIVNSTIRDEQSLAEALAKRERIDEELKKYSEKEAEELDSMDPNAVVQRIQYLDSVIRYVDTGVCPMCGHRDGKPPMAKEDAVKERQELSAKLNRCNEYRRIAKDWWDASDLYDKLSSATVTREQADSARRDIARRETLEKDRLQAKANEGWWAGQVKALNDQIAAKKQADAEADRARKVLEDLEAVRNAFHRDAVQQAVRSYGAGQINDRLLGYGHVGYPDS